MNAPPDCAREVINVDTLTELSLFSGYGGFTLGLRLAGVETRTVCYVENEPYCQRLIQQRITDGFLDDAPIWDDITTFDGRPWRGHVDIITGGFPCQPHSHAGKRLGKEDSRNLWPDTLRVIRDVEPRYVILENVRGLVDGPNPYSAEILGQLSEAGYDAVWGLYSASQAGAPHKRDRWWCLAYAQCNRLRNQPRGSTRESRQDTSLLTDNGQDGNVADTDNSGLETGRFPSGQEQTLSQPSDCNQRGWWQVEPDVGRVADGVVHRMDRLKALGNGIVPAVVARFLNE